MNFSWAYRYYIDLLMRASDGLSPLNQLVTPVTSPVYWAVFFVYESCAQRTDHSQEQRVDQVLPWCEQHSLWTKIGGLHSPPRWFCKLCFHWLRDTICSRSVTCSANRSPRIVIFAFESFKHQHFTIKSMDDELRMSLIHEDIDSFITGKSLRRRAVRLTGNRNIVHVSASDRTI